MSFGVGDPTAPYPRRQKSVEVLKAVVRHLKELERLLALEPSGQPLISNTPSAQAGTSSGGPAVGRHDELEQLFVGGLALRERPLERDSQECVRLTNYPLNLSECAWASAWANFDSR